jgi:hypothetical protein
MSRLTRVATALFVIGAFGAMPLAADWCGVNCEAADAAVHASSQECHHHSEGSPQLTSVPAPCGHDHAAVVSTAETSSPIASSWTSSADPVAVLFIASADQRIELIGPTSPQIRPPHRSVLLALSTILRI